MLIKIITEFNGHYRFLSNFYPASVRYKDIHYPTSEHAFQAAKCKDMLQLHFILDSPTPGMAKKLGKTARLREDWDDVKIEIMYEILRAKFVQNSDLQRKLLATGDAKLYEGNTWGDHFWGVEKDTLKGQNHLGKQLMRVRTDLRLEILGFDDKDNG